jgi:N6-adenosine-specific RNA methylase IME4
MNKRIDLYSGAQPARVLLADPPWAFDDALPGPKRGAESHYSCLSLEDIERFELPPLAKDCWLFLWRTGAHAREAFRVIDAWGFKYASSEIVWVKTTLDNSRIRIGMGRAVRNAHEVCMIAKRGKPERLSASVPSVIMAPRLRHSEKPTAFYKAVERFAEGPRVELFARRTRPGWQCFGNEIPEPKDYSAQQIAV